MSTGTQETNDSQSVKDPKDVYEAVIRTIDYNSGRAQPPLAKQASILGALHQTGYGSYGLERLHRTITKARSNGDIFRARDAEGNTRLGIDDPERLVEKIESNLEHGNSLRRDVIGLANQRIEQLREVDQ